MSDCLTSGRATRDSQCYDRFIPQRNFADRMVLPTQDSSHHRRGRSCDPHLNTFRDLLRTELFPSPPTRRPGSVRSAGSLVSDQSSSVPSEHLVTAPCGPNEQASPARVDPFASPRWRSPRRALAASPRRARTPKRKRKRSLLSSPRRALDFGKESPVQTNAICQLPFGMHSRPQRSDELCITPLRKKTQAAMFRAGKKSKSRALRKLRTVPSSPSCYRVLRAEGIVDDFYTHAVDWSLETNTVFCATQHAVHAYRVETGESACVFDAADMVRCLRYFATPERRSLFRLNVPLVTATACSPKGQRLAVGSSGGMVSVWEVDPGHAVVPTFAARGPGEEVGVAAWCGHWAGNCLVTGSKDSCELRFHDVRQRADLYTAVNGSSRVVSVRWAPDLQRFAVGGRGRGANVAVWDLRDLRRPCDLLSAHRASVRAMAWSPHERGVLATGGGNHDMRVCLWRVGCHPERRCIVENRPVREVNAGNQVCGLVWDPAHRRLLSAHGYVQNNLTLWTEKLDKVLEFDEWDSRVMHIARGPNGDVVTGSGGDNGRLRFWKAFEGKADDTMKARQRMTDDLNTEGIIR